MAEPTSNTNAMASDDSQFRHAVLGIDIGSTAARAVLAWRKGDKIQTEVLMFRDDTIHGSPRIRHEISSLILPFGDDPIKYTWANGYSQDKRDKLPVKFVPYVLLDKIEYMQEQNPVCIRLEKERSKAGFNEAHFKAVLETASKQFLRFIITNAKETLEMRKSDNLQIQINTIAMAVPSQWDATFQKVYKQLLEEALTEIPKEVGSAFTGRIHFEFHTDATAIAHHFLHASSDANSLNFRDCGTIPNIDAVGGSINTQLFIHCGGYHASSVLTTIQRDESGKRVLCEAERSHGAEGGTEWWIENLVDRIVDMVTPHGCPDEFAPTPEDINYFRRKITREKGIIMCGHQQDLILCPPRTGVYINTDGFTEGDSIRAFHVTFWHVKRMIRQQLQRVFSITRGWATRGDTVSIIVTGGSARHPAFMTWMQESCEELGLPRAITLETMADFSCAVQVARGAAWATLRVQAGSIPASKAPRRRIPEFGSEESVANQRLLRQLDLPIRKRDPNTDSRTDIATKPSSNDNVSPSGEASSSRRLDSAPEGPEADVNQTASKKRKASVEPDGVTPAKHINITRELPIRTASSTRTSASSTGKDTSSIPEKRIHNTRGLAIRTAASTRKDTSSTNKDASSTGNSKDTSSTGKGDSST